MPKRSPSLIIKEILTCIEHLQSYTHQISFEQFTTNFMIVEACLYNIQIIGQAVAQLDEDIRKEEPQVPWSLIKVMRNKLIHEYFGTLLNYLVSK